MWCDEWKDEWMEVPGLIPCAGGGCKSEGRDTLDRQRVVAGASGWWVGGSVWLM